MKRGVRDVNIVQVQELVQIVFGQSIQCRFDIGQRPGFALEEFNGDELRLMQCTVLRKRPALKRRREQTDAAIEVTGALVEIIHRPPIMEAKDLIDSGDELLERHVVTLSNNVSVVNCHLTLQCKDILQRHRFCLVSHRFSFLYAARNWYQLPVFWDYLWICLGGALGTGARYWLSTTVALAAGETFPLGTLVINVTGSIIIGFFSGMTGPEGRWLVSPQFRNFFMVGICGGYTTFSSFSLQTLKLAQDGQFYWAGLNVIGSVMLCLFGVWLGNGVAVWMSRP